MITSHRTLRLLFVTVFTTLIGAALAAASESELQSTSANLPDRRAQANTHYNSGVSYMEKGDTIAARGDSAFAYNYRATSEEKAAKQYRAAIEQFRKAIKLDDQHKEALNNLGYCLRRTGQLDQSREAYLAALAIDSTFEQAREYLGETYLALGRLEQAEQQLAFLTARKSTYAGTLARAIEAYRLQEISGKMNNGK